MRNETTPESPVILTPVENCNRCGARHMLVKFIKFGRPINGDLYLFTHWALCPTTGEPIVLYVVENKKEIT